MKNSFKVSLFYGISSFLGEAYASTVEPMKGITPQISVMSSFEAPITMTQTQGSVRIGALRAYKDRKGTKYAYLIVEKIPEKFLTEEYFNKFLELGQKTIEQYIDRLNMEEGCGQYCNGGPIILHFTPSVNLKDKTLLQKLPDYIKRLNFYNQVPEKVEISSAVSTIILKKEVFDQKFQTKEKLCANFFLNPNEWNLEESKGSLNSTLITLTKCPLVKAQNIKKTEFSEGDESKTKFFGRAVQKHKEGIFKFPETLKDMLRSPGELDETKISDCDFCCLDGVKEIHIGGKITEIGWQSFDSCSDLEKVILSENVQIVGPEAFTNCPKLTIMQINSPTTRFCYNSLPAKCKIIYQNEEFTPEQWMEKVKKEYPALFTRVFEEGRDESKSILIQEIPDFRNDQKNSPIDFSKINRVILQSDLREITEEIFSNCPSLEQVTIPDGLAKIGAYAFAYNKKLTNIQFSDDSQLAEIDNYAFYQCSSLTQFNIPDQTKIIGISSFNGCNLGNLSIPNSVCWIGGQAFVNNQNLREVTFNNSIFLSHEKQTNKKGTGIGIQAFDQSVNKIVFAGKDQTSLLTAIFDQGMKNVQKEKRHNFRDAEAQTIDRSKIKSQKLNISSAFHIPLDCILQSMFGKKPMVEIHGELYFSPTAQQEMQTQTDEKEFDNE